MILDDITACNGTRRDSCSLGLSFPTRQELTNDTFWGHRGSRTVSCKLFDHLRSLANRTTTNMMSGVQEKKKGNDNDVVPCPCLRTKMVRRSHSILARKSNGNFGHTNSNSNDTFLKFLLVLVMQQGQNRSLKNREKSIIRGMVD